ncbi:hypothetical protein VNO77_43986 [Canavalia gladiata]|uniref:Uncharacterized protein n=1 Tax=Canavalia gladiata TaxID=3824 RepID=A0AAN9JY40_CANGL
MGLKSAHCRARTEGTRVGEVITHFKSHFSSGSHAYFNFPFLHWSIAYIGGSLNKGTPSDAWTNDASWVAGSNCPCLIPVPGFLLLFIQWGNGNGFNGELLLGRMIYAPKNLAVLANSNREAAYSSIVKIGFARHFTPSRSSRRGVLVIPKRCKGFMECFLDQDMIPNFLDFTNDAKNSPSLICLLKRCRSRYLPSS